MISPLVEFQEVDPILLKQPAKRIFLPKEKSYAGCSISLHEELLEEPIEKFFSKTKQFIESTFPITFEAFKSSKTAQGYEVYFYRLKPQKKDLDVESLHAYLLHENNLYLLSYSAPGNIFSLNLTIFQKFLDQLKVMPTPFISAEEEKGFRDLIEKEKILSSDFLKSKSVQILLKKYRSDLKEDLFISTLFELRAFLYD